MGDGGEEEEEEEWVVHGGVVRRALRTWMVVGKWDGWRWNAGGLFSLG